VKDYFSNGADVPIPSNLDKLSSPLFDLPPLKHQILRHTLLVETGSPKRRLKWSIF
jgi:hypothetical protein